MARFKVQVGKLFYRNPPHPSSAAYLHYMREAMNGMTRKYEEVFKQVKDMTPEIMKEALEPTFELAKYYTPVKSGDLKRSGYLEIRQFRGQPRVEMGFARGGNPNYAAFVHERVDIPHAAPTRSKFLEAAMIQDLSDIRHRLINTYKGIL